MTLLMTILESQLGLRENKVLNHLFYDLLWPPLPQRIGSVVKKQGPNQININIMDQAGGFLFQSVIDSK